MSLAMQITIAVAIFVSTVAYNWLAVYGIKVLGKHHHRAALADCGTYLIATAALGALVYIGWWVIIPELLGQYLGTYWGSRYGSCRETVTPVEYGVCSMPVAGSVRQDVSAPTVSV